MKLEDIEKELAKLKKLSTDLDKNISMSEGKLETIIEQLTKEFGVETLEEANEKLAAFEKEMEALDSEITKQLTQLKETYADLS